MSIPAANAALARTLASRQADAIYRASQSNLRLLLWNAALGDLQTGGADGASAVVRKVPLLDMSPWFGRQWQQPAVAPLAHGALTDLPGPDTAGQSREADKPSLRLGNNAAYAAAIASASDRTRVPAAALAAIIDAEAGRGPEGRWNNASRNPRSSARGLGQFLSRTWLSEAERPSTFLHGLALANGWLTDGGRVRSESRTTVLALRLDSRCAIEATADYAAANVEHLRKAGIVFNGDPARYAQLAYIGHQLGAGDAVRFLTGSVSEDRARKLLRAQVGSMEASRRIVEAGDPARAHHLWLMSYVVQHIDASRFGATA